MFFLLYGCASLMHTRKSQFTVAVDAYGNDDYLTSKKYLIAPGDSTIDENSLQFLEFSAILNKAMLAKEYVETKDWFDADLIVFLSYGISDPQEYESVRTLPVWGETGISSIKTTSQTNTSSYGSVYGSAIRNSNNVYGSGYGTSNKNTTTNVTTNVTPSYGITGYKQLSSTYTKYLRYLEIDTYDLNVYRSTKKMKMVWTITMSSAGSGGDLRKVFPFMIVAGSGYFGKSSGEKKTIVIYEDDSRVLQLKGIE